MSEALTRLLEVDILSRCRDAVAPPDSFRRTHLYQAPLLLVLMRHDALLRKLYIAISLDKGGHKYSGEPEDSGLISLNHWKAFLHACGLVQHDISERSTTLCWAWSRMAIADASTAWGHLKEHYLPFTGFCKFLSAQWPCTDAIHSATARQRASHDKAHLPSPTNR